MWVSVPVSKEEVERLAGGAKGGGGARSSVCIDSHYHAVRRNLSRQQVTGGREHYFAMRFVDPGASDVYNNIILRRR